MKVLSSLFIMFLLPIYLFAQVGSINIQNNANIILNSNVNVIIDQPTPFGILLTGNMLGGIISDNEQSRVIWNINTNSGIYTIPFKYTNGNLIPLVVSITTPGTSMTKGQLLTSTYHTNNLNNPYPNGHTYFSPVTNMWDYNFIDNSMNVVDRFWIINFNNYSTNPITTLTLTYDNSELNGIAPTDLQAQYWSGSYWANPTLGISTPANRNVNSITNVNFNAPWVVSNYLYPLPIELLNFDVKYSNKSIVINWVTASEINNDYFEIEKSYNLLDWESISTVKGAGNSNSPLYYTSYDNEIIYDKEIYYKLKQVDYNGSYTESDIKFITVKSQNDVLRIDKLYVNNDILNIELSKAASGEINIIEISSGKILIKDKLSDSYYIKIPINNLKYGGYIVRIISNENVLIKKFKI